MSTFVKIILLVFSAIFLFSCADAAIQNKKTEAGDKIVTTPSTVSDDEQVEVGSLSKKNDKIPSYVLDILTYIRTHDEAPLNYTGGKIFYNREKILPILDNSGNRISYKEWDVHQKTKGKNRGPERIVTSFDKAYYTKDHYKTFILIKETY